MAEKRSKSILSGLKNMLHLDSETPSKPAPKPGASTRKKAAAPKKIAAPAQEESEHRTAAPEATPAASDSPVASKSEKKKVQNLPWYRHRQRW